MLRRFNPSKCVKMAISGIALAGLAMPAQAVVLIDDFSGLTSGGVTVHNQNLWASIPAGSGNVAVTTFAGNEVLRFGQTSTGPSRGVVRPLQSGTIADGSTSTLFLNFRANGLNLDTSFGLSAAAAPGAFADFEAQFTLLNVGGNLTLRARDGGAANDLTTLSAATDYSLWAVIDNAADSMDVYIQGGAFASQTQLATNLAFRNGTTDGLNRFFGLTTADIASPSTIHLDNIYIAAGANLDNPTVLPDGVLAKYALVSGTNESSPVTLRADHLTASAMTTNGADWGNGSVGFHTLHTINAVAPEGAGGNGLGVPDALDPDAYFTITLTPDGPTDFTGIEFTQVAGKTANTAGLNSHVVIRSSLDGFSDDLADFLLVYPGTEPNGTFVTALQFLDLSTIPGFGRVDGPLELRFYLYDNSGAAGKVGGFTDLTIFGAPSVPEPASLGCLALGFAALARRRRVGVR